jgi:hypothetical protein
MFTSHPSGATEILARTPDGNIKIIKKKKKRVQKFSKILDDISSDIMAEFSEVATLLPARKVCYLALGRLCVLRISCEFCSWL